MIAQPDPVGNLALPSDRLHRAYPLPDPLILGPLLATIDLADHRCAGAPPPIRRRDDRFAHH